MILRDAVSTVRSMLTGSLLDEVSLLAEPFDPAQSEVVRLKYPKRAVSVGSTICVGLNTLQVLNVSADGSELVVLPGADGGPLVACDVNEVVRIRPAFTTWAVVREMQQEIEALSSRDVGLWTPVVFETDTIDWVNGTYTLPPLADPDGSYIRLLKAEYRVWGTDGWTAFTEAEYQPAGGVIRVYWNPSSAAEYRITMARTFGIPQGYDDDLTLLGIGPEVVDIPMLGAASRLALGWEGRRLQPVSQGESRRAGEVQPGTNVSLSRMFALRKQERIAEELARLTGLVGWRQPATSGPTTGTLRGGRTW